MGWRNADFAMYFQLYKAFLGEFLRRERELIYVWGVIANLHLSLKRK
jgi:hypothetical protein